MSEYSATSGAILLDVWTAEEYQAFHIPGSNNLPVQELDEIGKIVDNKAMPIFVHCRSGGHSRQAAYALQQKGYKNVKNTGGISAYRGKVEQ